MRGVKLNIIDLKHYKLTLTLSLWVHLGVTSYHLFYNHDHLHLQVDFSFCSSQSFLSLTIGLSLSLSLFISSLNFMFLWFWFHFCSYKIRLILLCFIFFHLFCFNDFDMLVDVELNEFGVEIGCEHHMFVNMHQREIEI